MEYEYVLIWHSQYGKEDIDSFETRDEAKRMQQEYRIAFGGEAGYIEIKRRRKSA